MKIDIEIVDNAGLNSDSKKLIRFNNGKNLCASLKEASFSLDLKNGARLHLYGKIFYHLRGDGEIKIIDSNDKGYLEMVFSEQGLMEAISSFEGQYIGLYVDSSKNLAHIFSDRYARLDAFYSYDGSNFYLAAELDFIFEKIKPVYDQMMLAHIFSVYGWYTPKGLTIYKNVKRLRVGEIITLSDSGLHSETIKFKPLEIENYTDKDLEIYYKILKESVIARANRKGKTWVSSSSGWDSSVLLGLLVDEFGSNNVSMLTGSMKYSEGTEVINKFEISKIKKIGQFYGIKPTIVDLDFKSARAMEYWKKKLPYFKSKHLYTFVTYNFCKLSDELENTAGKTQTIFNGETSDSFHNFGFSQFATFFHTKKSFTEYADKMNCYLYGPSFFKKIIDGEYERDKVFQIFKKMMGGIEFASGFNDKEAIIESYLFPFFYGSSRVPFAKTHNNLSLTEKGKKVIYNFSFREYIPEVLSNMTENNIYSWLIYLYHSFHSQGSTVNVQKYAMEMNGHRWRCPFNDYRMIEFLSKAPESWGRGLELNNTKYPLKWVAKNKIKFPYELLDEGPHSYLYDVLEGFSLAAEITYRSGVTVFFKEVLKDKPYRSILTDEYFDLRYIDTLVEDYLNGKEVSGGDFNNLVSLITLCVTGWYQ